MGGFFNTIKFKLQAFMAGRYGSDRLTVYCTYAALILILLRAFTGLGFLTALAYAVIIWSIFRMFSKNRVARARENAWVFDKLKPAETKLKQAKVRFANRKTTKYFHCPKCKSLLKMPRGVGEKTVTCGKCAHVFKQKA